MSVPTASAFAGTMIVVGTPSGVAADAYVPLVSVMVPVGAGSIFTPNKPILTVRLCAVVMDGRFAMTVTKAGDLVAVMVAAVVAGL